MTWNDLNMTADFLLLCAIAYGVYRVKKAIEDMHSGLGQLLGEHREIAKKILFQLDSGEAVSGLPHPRFPLHVEVHTIKEDLRDFQHKWFELHIPDFVREKVERRMEEHERIMEAHKRRKEQEREAKTKDTPENGDT